MREHPEGTAGDGAAELTEREAAFAARLGTALRASKAPPEDFDVRVMQTIRAGGDVSSRPPIRAEQGRPWWTRKRAVALSPLGGLAMAAGFAGIVALGTLAAVRDGSGAGETAVVAAARVDTVHLVRFVIREPGAQRVSLVGDFNGWSRDATPLEASADAATWTLTLPLAPGRYEYAFVVDGERWVADPSARTVQDEFGGETSVLRLAGNGDRVM
jgi:Glycogen recognition site of AMP-activated protein kinase